MIGNKGIAFIGPGVMGEALAVRLVAEGRTTHDLITMSGPNEERLAYLANKHGFRVVSENCEAIKDVDIVVFSVKPQSLPAVLSELSDCLDADTLVISVIAGATVQTIQEGLNHDRVIRSMPNTPAQVGEGITVWTATEAVTTEQREQARQTFSAFGDEIYVENEDYLDMATAISGTGPSYVFLFMEAMVDAGVHLGFPRRISEQLVIQTVKGSVAYYEHSPSHLARLRNQVTSPGGTSAAALYYLDKAGFRTALSRAIWAAYERSVQLGSGKRRGKIDPEADF
jgi:pyrroline-5-carboxylate reductase